MSTVSPLSAASESKARKKCYPDLVTKFRKMAADQNVVPMCREFCRFMGSLEGGLFLAQLLYWQPRTKNPGGWLYKTDAQWAMELWLSKHAVREVRLRLKAMGVIETTLRRANGSPTTHYRLDLGRFEQLWRQFLDTPAGDWAEELETFEAEVKAEEKARKSARKRPS